MAMKGIEALDEQARTELSDEVLRHANAVRALPAGGSAGAGLAADEITRHLARINRILGDHTSRHLPSVQDAADDPVEPPD